MKAPFFVFIKHWLSLEKGGEMRSLAQSKKVLLGVVFSFSLAVSFGPSACAEGLLDKAGFDIEVSASVDYYSNYLWRGFTLDKDPVIQPGVSISALGFSYNFWSSWDAGGDDELASDELDYVFDYTRELNDLISVSVGHTYYDFPATNLYSREFYAGVGLSRIPGLDWPIETSVTYYHDYGDEGNGGGDGNYVSLDASYSYTLIGDLGITADFGLHWGYNNELFIAGDGYDLGLSFGFTIPLTDSLSISPTVNYAAPFGDVEDEADGAQEDRVYAGISLAWVL
jgi:hypothetical protein